MSQTWRQKRDMEDLKRRDRAAYDKLVAAREKALGALGKFDENLQDLRQHLKQNPTAGMPSLSDVMSGNIELSSESEGEEDPDKLVQGEPAPSEPATNETQGHEEEDEDDEFERRARLRRESKSSTSVWRWILMCYFIMRTSPPFHSDYFLFYQRNFLSAC
eukprot:m.653363 g.653363  ORF g.653363 m.653363 type:complete len:161 (+) comp58403_c0_seq1:191-673(+)